MLGDKYAINYVTSSSELAVDRSFFNSLKWKRFSTVALYGGLQYDIDSTQWKILADSNKVQTLSDFASVRGMSDSTLFIEGFDYLKGTEEEVKLIAANLLKTSVKVEVKTNISGTEESFKLLSGQKMDVIHIATHGFFIPGQMAKFREGKGNIDNENKFVKADNPLLRSGADDGRRKQGRGPEVKRLSA